jgi:hypothetical protein
MFCFDHILPPLVLGAVAPGNTIYRIVQLLCPITLLGNWVIDLLNGSVWYVVECIPSKFE